MSDQILPRVAKKLDNTIGEVGSWHDKEVVRLHADGKTIQSEPYQARYISSAEIAADQDSNLRGTPPYQLREGTPGSFNSLIRASSSDRIVPGSSEPNRSTMQTEQQRFTLHTNGSSYIYEPYIDNCKHTPPTPAIQVTPAGYSSAEQGRSLPPRGRTDASRKSHIARRKSSSPATPIRRPSSLKATNRASKLAETTLADVADSIEVNIRGGSRGTDKTAVSIPFLGSDGIYEDVNNSYPVEQRRDSAVPTTEPKLSTGDTMQQTSDSPDTQARVEINGTSVSTAPGPVHVPYSKRTRGSRNMLAELEVSGTSEMAPTGMQGASKEMVYKSFDGKIYKYLGNEEPGWIVEGPWEKDKIPSSTPKRTPASRRGTSVRLSSPTSTRTRRSWSRGE